MLCPLCNKKTIKLFPLPFTNKRGCDECAEEYAERRRLRKQQREALLAKQLLDRDYRIARRKKQYKKLARENRIKLAFGKAASTNLHCKEM